MAELFSVVVAPIIAELGQPTVVATEVVEAADGTWALIDGGTLPIAEFPELFAVIDRKYGGTATGFNLPPPVPGAFAHLIKVRSGGEGLMVGAILQYAGAAANLLPA